MDVPVLVASQQQYTHGADPMAFLEEAEPKIHGKLEEEINALNGVKFQLAFKVQLRENNPDGSAENTDPVLHHQQEAILQKSETKRALNQAFPRIIKQNARKVDTEMIGVRGQQSSDSLAGHRKISATERRVLHPTSSRCKI